MGNWKRHLSLALAFVFATLSSVGVYQYLKNRETVLIAQTEPTVPVVVARHDVAMGMRLTEDDLVLQDWPKSIVPDQSFRSVRNLVGRTLQTSVITKEPITNSKLLREGESLSTLIPPGMRGITVEIRKSNTLAKILERGSIVDVIAMFENGNAPPTTKVIAQAVRVLAVHDRANALNPKSDTKYMEVTLLVTLRDAQWLVIAMNKGVIQLVMRNEAARIS